MRQLLQEYRVSMVFCNAIGTADLSLVGRINIEPSGDVASEDTKCLKKVWNATFEEYLFQNNDQSQKKEELLVVSKVGSEEWGWTVF